MKIESPTIWTPPEPLQEVSGTPAPGKVVEEKPAAPAELQRNPAPKTDSVEMKENSNVAPFSITRCGSSLKCFFRVVLSKCEDKGTERVISNNLFV